MKESVNMEEAVNLTLDSIDSIQIATAPKNIYARVLRRLEYRESSMYDKILSYMSKPVIALAIILLVLLLDFRIVIQNKRNDYNLPDIAVKNMYQEDYELAANFYDYDVEEQ